jgi:hypothetical protein
LNNGSKSKTDFINSTTEDWFGEMDDESVKNTATSMGSTSSVPNETVIFESKHTDSPSSPRFSGIKVFQDRTGAKHSGVTNPNINPQHNVKHQSTSIISTATKAGVSIPVTAVKDNSNNAIPTTKPQIHQRKTLDNSQRPPASSLSISSATIPTKKEDEWVLVGHDGSQPAEAPVDVEIARLNERIAKIERFRKVLDQPIVDLGTLCTERLY